MSSKPSKSFTSDIDSAINPTMQFISGDDSPIQGSRVQVPEGFKLNPMYIEKKTRRLGLLLQPSLYERLKAKATDDDVSINELIHVILNDALHSK